MKPMNHRPARRRLPAALTLMATLALATFTWTAPARGAEPTVPDAVPGEVVLLVESDEAELLALSEGETLQLEEAPEVVDEAAEVMGDFELESVELVADDLAGQAVLGVELADEAATDAFIEAMDEVPGVYAQPNYVYELLDDEALPNDEFLDYQYYLEPLGNGSGDSGSDVFGAWQLLRSVDDLEPVTVAVLDSGINAEHEDLQETVRFDLGYNAITKKPGATLVASHGTHVTGIIGATANNTVGVAGVGAGIWDAEGEPLLEIVPINVCDSGGGVPVSAMVEAVNYLERLDDEGKLANLKVVNMSFGRYTTSDSDEGHRVEDRAMRNAVEALEKRGVLCVASGGNGTGTGASRRPLTTELYPSDFESCLSVTSLTRKGGNSSWSDYNSAKDLSAPGEDIASTDADGGYALNDGTSFSAPIVSGVAALMASADPSITPAQMHRILTSTASPLPSKVNDHGDASGSAGALNAKAAVEETLRQAGKLTEPVQPGDPVDTGLPIHRLFNTVTGEHLFTKDGNEAVTLTTGQNPEWRDEGIGFTAPSEGDDVTRFFNTTTGEHLYTMTPAEIAALDANPEWRNEGMAWKSAPADTGRPVYRLFSVKEGTAHPQSAHHYTADHNEYVTLPAFDWSQEGTKWYALPEAA